MFTVWLMEKKETHTQEIEILTEISEIWTCNKINMTGYIAILPYLTQSIITFMFSAGFCCILETAGGEKLHTQKVKQSFCMYNSVLHLRKILSLWTHKHVVPRAQTFQTLQDTVINLLIERTCNPEEKFEHLLRNKLGS